MGGIRTTECNKAKSGKCMCTEQLPSTASVNCVCEPMHCNYGNGIDTGSSHWGSSHWAIDGFHAVSGLGAASSQRARGGFQSAG